MPSEQEVLDFLGVTPEALGLSATHLSSPEMGNMTVFPMSLRGLSGGDLAAMRRMRLSYTSGVVLQEHHLTPETEVDACQGASWLSHAASTHVAKRPDELKLRGSKKLRTFAELEGLASAHLGRRQSSMVPRYEGGAANKGEAAAESSEPPEEGDAYLPAKKRRHLPAQPVQAPSAARGLLAGPQARKPVTASKGRGRGRGGRTPGAKTQPVPDVVEEDEPQVASLDMAQLKDKDTDMYEVATVHESMSGKPSICFHNLQVLRFLRGDKVGQSLNGAPWLPEW